MLHTKRPTRNLAVTGAMAADLMFACEQAADHYEERADTGAALMALADKAYAARHTGPMDADSSESREEAIALIQECRVTAARYRFLVRYIEGFAHNDTSPDMATPEAYA